MALLHCVKSMLIPNTNNSTSENGIMMEWNDIENNSELLSPGQFIAKGELLFSKIEDSKIDEQIAKLETATQVNSKFPPMKEEVTLLETEKDGEELVLLDGRKLMVNPGDIPTACTWTPTSGLEITDTNGEGMFSLKIRNINNNIEITAMWLG